MRALLVYPLFPKTYWGQEYTNALTGKRAVFPPLGLLTAAALLPRDWELRLVDLNVEPLADEDIAWADVVMISAMRIQSPSFHDVVERAHAHGKRVVAGGPYVTTDPDAARDVDHLVIGESEQTLPELARQLERGCAPPRVAAPERPDVSRTPVPRFDLLRMELYDGVGVQFSRGCPFNCEFCDIIEIFGRVPRTKTPDQLLGELDAILATGFRGAVFVVDGDRASPTFGSVLQTLTPPPPAPSGGRFGAAVAALNSRILVGAPMDLVVGASGAAYLFDGAAATPFVNPTPAAGDRFGAAVTAVGSNALVGAPGEGRAFLFNGATGTATLVLQNPTPQAGDEFGAALAALGTDLVIGAPGAGRAFLLDGITGAPKLVLQNPTPEAGGRFGHVVAALGTNLLVGAPGAAESAGKAFLFDGATGQLLATFTSPTAAAGDQFGSAIAALGNNILVGAPSDSTGAAGAAYVFDASGSLLETIAKPAPTAGNHFGAAVAAVGGNALVGAPFDTIEQAGSGTAYLFDGTTLAAAFRKRLPAAAFGSALASLGSDLVAGAPADGQEGGGRAYRLDGATGAVRQTFTSPSPTPGSRFGTAVAVTGNAVAVGAPFADVGGASYLFDGDAGQLLRTLNDPAPHSGDQFGYAIAATATQVIVGAPLDDASSTDAGAAYVFDGQRGSLLRIIQKPDPQTGDFFGAAIAAAGDEVLIGAPTDGSGGVTRAGAAYLFQISTGTLLRVFRKPAATPGDFFGRAVAFVNGNVLVGAPLDGSGALEAGAAYLFDGTSGTLLRTFLKPVPAAGDAFGAAVAAVDGLVLIAAPFDDAGAVDAGAAYLFDTTIASPLVTFRDPAAGGRDQFGLAVGAQGGSVVVGSPGPSRAYRFDPVGPSLAAHSSVAARLTANSVSGLCGNGIVDPGEQCDDGNGNDFDDCRNDCTLPLCCFIVPATEQYCDDGNPCTDDTFDPSRGCAHERNDRCCQTSGECSDGETCRPCDACFLNHWACCDNKGGAACLVPVVTDTCAELADGVGCGDSNACTVDDACGSHTCSGTPRNCDDGRACTDDTCNEASGCVNTPTRCNCTTDADCDDHNPCTEDSCAGGTCRTTPLTDGHTCGGGDLCSGLEICARGQCVRTPPAACFDLVRCACAGGLACADGPVPARITAPFDQACGLIGAAKALAADTTQPKKKRVGKAKGKVRRALTLFGNAGHAVGKQQQKHRVSPQCADMLAGTIGNATTVAKRLRGDLPSCTP